MASTIAVVGPRRFSVLPRATGGRDGGPAIVLILSAALILVAFASTGCSANRALVGEWHVDGSGQKVVDLTNDGRFESTCLGIPTGTFQVTSAGKAVEFQGGGKSETLACSVAGSTMSLSGSLADGTNVHWALTRAASSVRPVK